MSAPRVYLDHNASSPLRPSARVAMLAALDTCGNASSVHAEGRRARALVEEARARLAQSLGADPRDVVFVSGATEAANALLTPRFGNGQSPVTYLLASGVEHACVLTGHRFGQAVEILPVDMAGRLNISQLQRALSRPGGALLSLQAANNETGVLQPLPEAAALVHAAGGLVACDAVQLFGRGDCRVDTLGVDAVFVSSHKIGGPKGAGAIAFRPGRRVAPLIRGGGQERGARGGTENVAAIAGFAAAAREACETWRSEAQRLVVLRDDLEAHLRDEIEGLTIFAPHAARLSNTSAFATPDITAETLLIALDLAGFAVSSGSACSSGKVQPSHVLAAMGVDDHMARGALRISLGWTTTSDDVARFCETFQKTVRDIRARRSGRLAVS